MHTGTWLVDGNPQVILFDIGAASWKLDEYKLDLWTNSNIGVPHLDIETNDAIILGYQVATFIKEVRMKFDMVVSIHEYKYCSCSFFSKHINWWI